MFNFTLPELVVIFVVALLVFGPKKLPEIGAAIGRGIGEFRRALQDVKEQVNTDISTSHEPGSTPDKTPEQILKEAVEMHDSDIKEQQDTPHKDHHA
ncbi:MAG: twin-arginine translocase TatA/TatE family subunit [Nitrospirae bacterium]|nr:twin-arginine translocase TatA/TatE family subunit [Nitrospirota bacterium]